MGVGVGLVAIRERKRPYSEQGGFCEEPGGGWGTAEFEERKQWTGSAESGSGRVRGHYSAVGSDLVALAFGLRKQVTNNDFLPLIRTKEEGQRMLIAAKIATAVWDALGQGMTGQNRDRLISSAWAYLESGAFRHDLELVGVFVDAEVFLRELRELAGE